jgi:hypothetical protein
MNKSVPIALISVFFWQVFVSLYLTPLKGVCVKLRNSASPATHFLGASNNSKGQVIILGFNIHWIPLLNQLPYTV